MTALSGILWAFFANGFCLDLAYLQMKMHKIRSPKNVSAGLGPNEEPMSALKMWVYLWPEAFDRMPASKHILSERFTNEFSTRKHITLIFL